MKYFSQSFLYFSLGVSRDLVSCSRMSFSRIRHDDVIVRFSKGNWKEDRCEMQGWSYSEFCVPTQRQISAITYYFGSLIKFFSRKSRHSRHDIDRNAPCTLSFSLCLSLLFFFVLVFFRFIRGIPCAVCISTVLSLSIALVCPPGEGVGMTERAGVIGKRD